jgi:hypothetical protein
MSPAAFAVFVLLGFLVPVPLLAWLDRPRPVRAAAPRPGRTG